MPSETIGVPGHSWSPNGQSVYWGPALRLYRWLEDVFLAWAAEFKADEYYFPTFLAASDLAKLDYLRSFQHLATFPLTLSPEEQNLKRFAEAGPVAEDGSVRLTQTSPVRDILTPSACYHIYALIQGSTIGAPRFFTTRNTCFRREAYYQPLQRQWAFSMREIVCVGPAESVLRFLQAVRETVDGFLKRIDLPVTWTAATDPFFNPLQNPKFLAQKTEPLKTEIIYGDNLAISSLNFHRTYICEAFGLTLPDGQPACSGCVGFGIDRWIYAFSKHYGPDEKAWPLNRGLR